VCGGVGVDPRTFFSCPSHETAVFFQGGQVSGCPDVGPSPTKAALPPKDSLLNCLKSGFIFHKY
jgi:hypothetical protein